MLDQNRVLAVVPARSGSKGIPHKNMVKIGGKSLITLAAEALAECKWVDRRIISTDSSDYADEAKRHGLDSPFLRPAELATDTSSSLDVTIHALDQTERCDQLTYDLLLIVEPTCPLRRVEDVERCAQALLTNKSQSAVTVSLVDSKFHPNKVFRLGDDGHLSYFSAEGASIKRRQQLEPLYYRNGACYALRRLLLLRQKTLISDDATGVLIDRELVNIDEPRDLEYARWLWERTSL